MSPRGPVPGTQGYAEQAGELIGRYEAVAFLDKHRAALALLPAAPGLVLDVGAGTGADAAWFASRGHRVVAVEPTGALRSAGRALHPSPAIEWVDDSLPQLAAVAPRGPVFDAVMLTAVWMHLDEAERRAALPTLAGLLAPDGVLVFSLRHGPVPAGRRMFEVSGEETIALGRERGLRPVLQARRASVQPANRQAGVRWTYLVLRRGA